MTVPGPSRTKEKSSFSEEKEAKRLPISPGGGGAKVWPLKSRRGPKVFWFFFSKKNNLSFVRLRAFALILAGVTLVRLPTFYRSVLDWDESLYMLMARAWAGGHLPYTTIWDNKPIGIYAIFAVFEAIFRAPVLAIRVAADLATALTAYGLWLLSPKLLPDTDEPLRGRLAGLAAAAFVLGSLSNDGLSANTELFMESFSVFAVLAAVSPGFCATAPARRGFYVGLLFAMACMTKYVAVFEAPAIGFALLLYAGESRAAKCVGAGAGAAALPLLTILTYALAGHLSLWWQCSIAANFVRAGAAVSTAQLHQVVFVILPRWLPYVAAALVAVCAAPFSWTRIRRTGIFSTEQRAHVLLLLWLAGGALGAAAAKSFYDHYFLQLLPPLCLALVWVLARPALAARLATRARFLTVSAALLVIPALAGASALGAVMQSLTGANWAALSPGMDTPARIRTLLRPLAARGATLYVFDGQPVIYALTGAVPPTRFVLPSVLTRCFLAHVAGVDAAAEVARILNEHPEFIVLNPYPPSGAGVNRSVYAEMSTAIAGGYALWQRYADAAVYRLRPGGEKNIITTLADSCQANRK